MAQIISFDLTKVGQIALWKSNNQGVEFELTHIQFGSSKNHFENEYNASSLGDGQVISRISSASRISDDTIKIISNIQNDKSYDCYEIGVWCGHPEEEGSILFAIAVSNEEPFIKMMANVNFLFSYNLTVTTVDIENIVINNDPNITIVYEEIKNHENADDPHTNYLHKEKDNVIKGSNTFEKPIIGNLNGIADHSKTTDQLKTGREITLHGAVTAKGEVFDGSKNISIEVLKIKTEKLEGIVPTDNLSGSYNINAESATRLETPRKINGVEFDGTEDIELTSEIEGDMALLYAPIAYPKSSPPTGYISLYGQYINNTVYPELRELYGSYLPDMRAYSIRGLDGGRGIDIGRTVLSSQTDDIKEHKHNAILNDFAFGKDGWVTGYPHWSSGDMRSRRNLLNGDIFMDSAGGAETRVKNIAFLYIVRAGGTAKMLKNSKNAIVFDELENVSISNKDQTITLYGYNDNGVYVGEFEYFWAFGTGYARNSTNIKPPEYKADEVAVFNGELWDIKANNFGKTSYSVIDQSKKTIDYYGDVESGYTLLEPSSLYDTWNGEAWEDQRTEDEKRADFQPLSMTKLKLSFLKHGYLEELDKLINSCDLMNRHFGIQLNSSENIHRTGDLVKFLESELSLLPEEIDVIWNDGINIKF